MRLSLDICCLKRPFDDLSSTRVRVEAEAVLALLQAAPAKVQLIHARAQDLENAQNPVRLRAERVRRWLDLWPVFSLPDDQLVTRTKELMSLGFKSFDAFHLSSAELCRADVFATCDDALMARAKSQLGALRVRVANPVDLVLEVLP
jgi:hypothetical protein